MPDFIRILLLAGTIALAVNAKSARDTSPDATSSYDWQLAKEASGVEVYTADVAGSKFKIFKGVITLDTSMASILGVLNDTSACSKWLHLCERSEILELTSFSRRIIYQVNDMPFPVSDRDVVILALTSHEPDTGKFTITLESRPDLYPIKKPVRIRISRGSYTLTPVADGRIEVIWQHFTDPAGSLRPFLVNALVEDVPLKSLANLKNLVADEKYQALKIDYDEEGTPVGLIESNRTTADVVR